MTHARLEIMQNPYLPVTETRLRAWLRVESAEQDAELALQVRLRLADDLESVRRDEEQIDLRPTATTTAGSIDVPLGSSWDRPHDHELVFRVDAADRPRNEHLQAAVVRVVTGGSRPATTARAIRVHWVDESESRSSRAVAEPDLSLRPLADAVRTGCEAYLSGRHEQARARWKEAEVLAREAGAKESSWRLSELTSGDLVDPRDLVKLGQAFMAVGGPSETSARCPDCSRIAMAFDRFCEQCGSRLQPGERR